MRRGFTLIELLVIVGILATMVSIGVGSLSTGQGMARVRGATRDVYAAIRHARSTALVTGQRVLVNYSNEMIDDEPSVKIEVVAAKIMSSDGDRPQAQPYYVMEYKELPQKQKTQAGGKFELVHIRKPGEGDGEKSESSEGGETLEEFLFSPMDENVIKGMRILVKKGDEVLTEETTEQTRSRISVFSNVDYLQSRYKEAKAEAAKKDAESGGLAESGKGSAASSGCGCCGANDMGEAVSVVWETNGAVEPHRIWIYSNGKKPEEGLMLNVDSFGAIKVLSGDGKEDD